MGRISEEDINRVRDATDLVSIISERVVLKQKGRLYWGCCPFHNEKTPSFKVDPSTQLWHCFGCGLGGDVFGFVMRIENEEFPDAVRSLADRANIEIVETGGTGVSRDTKTRLKDACEETADFYHKVLTQSKSAEAAAARDYLSARGFGSEVAKRWSLGFAPGHRQLVSMLTQKGFTEAEIIGANVGIKSKNGSLLDRFFDRVMFPIHDLQGKTIAFGGRVMGKGEPKYLNTQETPIFHKSGNMYAIDKAKSAIVATGTALVVEGYTDVIAAHEAGITNTVATLGTALTQQHIKMLSRFAKRIVYVFDGDEAGKRAADRASEFIDLSLTPESGSRRTELLVAMLPADSDPADYIGKQGADAFRAVIDSAVPLLQFSIDRRFEQWDLEIPEERSRALHEALTVLAPVKGSILADDYVRYIADKLLIDYRTVAQTFDSLKPILRQDQRQSGPSQPGPPASGSMRSDEGRNERELLALMVTSPSLRVSHKDLFSEIVWSKQMYSDLASVILSLRPDTSVAEAVAVAGNMIPDAQSILTEGTIEVTSDEEAYNMAKLLVRLIKQADLQRRIEEGNAKLRSNNELTEEGADRLFSEIAQLQKELQNLRASGA